MKANGRGRCRTHRWRDVAPPVIVCGNAFVSPEALPTASHGGESGPARSHTSLSGSNRSHFAPKYLFAGFALLKVVTHAGNPYL